LNWLLSVREIASAYKPQPILRNPEVLKIPCSVNPALRTRLHPPLFKEVLQLLPPKAHDTRHLRSRTLGKQSLTNNKFRFYLPFDNEGLDMRVTFDMQSTRLALSEV
jgi:hypothetical protein